MSAKFPFKAVIFDMDGVIVDTEMFYMTELRAYIDEIGAAVSDGELFATVGIDSRKFNATITDWINRTGAGLSVDEAFAQFDAWCEQYPHGYAELLNLGVSETIKGLRDLGVRVALASSSPLDNIEEVLGECGLRGAFEVVTSGEQFRESKPNPEIYLHTLERLGLAASECCCVEDSAPGIAAGKAAGLTVFAKREERFGFSQGAADCIIDSISDLIPAALELRG